jgi:two-component system, OmpR family, sensor kinase
MIKSLRLRLQLFHAGLLTIAVIVFGAAFYRQLHRTTMNEIDAGLLNHARILESELKSMSPRPNEEQINRLSLQWYPMNHRPPPPPMRRDREVFRQDPPPPLPPLFPRHNESPAYVAVFADDGRLIRSFPREVQVDWITSRPIEFRNRDGRREVQLLGPHRFHIVVGRDIGSELRRLSSALVPLCLIGLCVVGLGLFGGWWLANKAIKPIQQITETAQSITTQKLSERVDTTNMDRELQSLGNTLNSMLSRIESGFEKQCRFTADASHDLRTPLAVMMSHSELALSRPRTSDEYQTSLRTCLAAAGRMKSLVDGLLQLARSDANQLELHRSTIDLQELAIEAVGLFTPYAAEHRVILQIDTEPSPCFADRTAIMQVISNLLDNAIRYNRIGGTVTLVTRNSPDHASLEIKDTGPGIPTEDLPRIFDRFFRVDEARIGQDSQGRSSGSGLGLSICKAIVEAHGGQINATSQSGKGSSLLVELPSAF